MKKLFVFMLCLFWVSLSVSQAKTEMSPYVSPSEGSYLKKLNTAGEKVAPETENNTVIDVICSFAYDYVNGVWIEVRVYCDYNTGAVTRVVVTVIDPPMQ